MSIKDLIAKSPQELTEELLKLRREQFNLRMGAAAGQPAKPDQFRRVRRSIARVKTVLNQKRAQGDGR
jgi:large subunit ribosomal protein L29